MKRFAVLFGMLAVVVACSISYATAPQVRDLPDVRLGILDGETGLPVQALDAYDVADYFTDIDQDPTELTVSILNIQKVPGPGAGAVAAGSPAVVDFDGASELIGEASYPVDIYPSENPGWTQYRVQVTDSAGAGKGAVGDAAISQVAIAKLSTISLNAPTITDGVLLKDGGESAMTRQFTYVYVGQDAGELYRLDTAILPEDASADVNWSLYINDVIMDDLEANFDANGRWIGLQFESAAPGAASASAGGLFYEIDANGMLRLTPGGSVSRGPWVIGILATNSADANDSDGSRILVGVAMVPEASPEVATLGTSVTFNDLAPAIIPASTNVQMNPATRQSGFVGAMPADEKAYHIAPNCGWQYKMGGTDSTIQTVDLEIVDLATDGDLPVAAQIWGGDDADTAHIAGGMAIKATLEAMTLPIGNRGVTYPNARQQADGFRLYSRAFTGIEPTDVITFAMSVATNAPSATDLPRYQMNLQSGFAGVIVERDIRYIPVNYRTIEGDNFQVAQLDLPTADQGWHTLSVTYSPASTIKWWDFNNDGNFDEYEMGILAGLGQAEGWDGTNENSVVKAQFTCVTHQLAQNDVTLWMDNFRVYRSAYELDLALGNEVLSTNLVDNDLIDFLQLPYTTGAIDGSFEALADTSDAELSASGFYAGGGVGSAPMNRHWANGVGPTFQDPNYGDVLALANYDHTMNAGSGQCLSMTIQGDDGADGVMGANIAFRAQFNTSFVAASGSGIYAVEAFLSKPGPSNMINTYRDPDVRVVLSEVAPNYLSTNSGYMMFRGGLPESVNNEAPFNWLRCVAQMYIPDAEIIQGKIMVMDTFQGNANNFSVPVLVDDVKVYKVGDPAMFFDANLFNG